MATGWTISRRSELHCNLDCNSVIYHWECHRRKKEGREPHARSEKIHKLHGLKYAAYIAAAGCQHVCVTIVLCCRAKLYNRQRFKEKILMKKMYDILITI